MSVPDEKLKDMHDIAVLANYLAHVKVGRSLSRNCWTFRRRNSCAVLSSAYAITTGERPAYNAGFDPFGTWRETVSKSVLHHVTMNLEPACNEATTCA